MPRRQQFQYISRHTNAYRRLAGQYRRYVATSRRPRTYRVRRAVLRRPRGRRAGINGRVRRYKQAVVHHNRRYLGPGRTITARCKNVEFFSFHNSTTIELSAFAGHNLADGVKGLFTYNLTMGLFAHNDELANLKDKYKTFSILNMVITVQLLEVKNNYYRGLADAGFLNIARVNTGGIITPNLFALTQYEDSSPIPPGAGGATADAVDSSLTSVASQWRSHPRAKQVIGKKPTSMYWTCPTYARGRKHDTVPIDTAGTDRVYLFLDAIDSNQRLDKLHLFWQDYIRYAYAEAAEGSHSTLRLVVKGQMFIKAQDSTAWTATQ